MRLEDADPKGLVRESYNIEGITAEECRSIFMDWALSLPTGQAPQAAASLLHGYYATRQDGHPMNVLLAEAATPPAAPRRRGGRSGRG
ncbi:MAG: hypothetical protein LBE86_03305 [Gemmobacter sp.]|jgi:hypothetical protein|nr:hypothetical protein [Gemmobacter sp.]